MSVRGTRPKGKKGEDEQTEGVDDTVGLVLHTRQAADPLATITKSAETFNLMRAIEGSGEKVPYVNDPRVSVSQRIYRNLASKRRTNSVRWPGSLVGGEPVTKK